MTTRSLAETIRPLKARRPQRRPGRVLHGRSLVAISMRERIEERLVPYLETMREAFPQLEPRRRMYDGAWVFCLEADLPRGTFRGRPYRAFCRIEFALRLDAARGEYTVECRSTVYDRDLPTERMVGRFAGSPDTAGEFAEVQCLHFARRFLEESPRSFWRHGAA